MKILRYTVYSLISVALCGCSADVLPQGDPAFEHDPVVIASDDQTVQPGTWVRLDGSSSYDPQGYPLSFLWSQVGGPDVELQSWRTPIASFTAPAIAPGEALVFQLEVNNGAGRAATITQVRVIQQEPPPDSDDDPEGDLHADAGPDQGAHSAEWVTLDGSGSGAGGGPSPQFRWRQLSGAAVDIVNADQAIAAFEAPVVSEDIALLIFELLVTRSAASASDTVTIVVVARSGGDEEEGGGGCSSDAECDDEDPCTVDSCDSEGICQNIPVSECEACSSDSACDDADLCTVDACGPDGVCDHRIIAGCNPEESCLEDYECIDHDPCTLDDCLDVGVCAHTAKPNCLGGPEAGPLLLTNMNDPHEIEERYDEWGVHKRVEIFTSWCIDPNLDGLWSEEERIERTDYCLEHKVPQDYDGYLCLDWETNVTGKIVAGPEHPQYAQTIAEMLRLLNYVKARRPQAKCGYFTMPLSKFSQDEQWLAGSRGLHPVFQAADVLFPHIYDFYPCSDDPEDRNYECRLDFQKFSNVIRLALELSDGKPVLLYSYHRYHHGDLDYAFQLLPEEEYFNHIRHLTLEVEHNGRRPDGVVTWGADRYYYTRAHEVDEYGRYTHNDPINIIMRREFAEEMEEGETIEEYITRLQPVVYERTSQALFGP